MSAVLTFVAAKDGGVGEQQQGVVEEALKHGRLHLQLSQELAADGRPADQQGQDLTHQDGLQQAPAESVTSSWAKQKLRKSPIRLFRITEKGDGAGPKKTFQNSKIFTDAL